MVKVSFGMLFDCVTPSSKHMLQVRCSSVEIKPLFALPEHHPPPAPGTAGGQHTMGLASRGCGATAHSPGRRRSHIRRHHRRRCGRHRFSAGRRRRKTRAGATSNARQGEGDEGPARAAAADGDGVHEDAAAAPGRPFDSTKPAALRAGSVGRDPNPMQHPYT